MQFAMNLMIAPGIFVCSSFPTSICMFIVSKALLTSNATVIVRAVGATWLNPSATVLSSVCSAVNAVLRPAPVPHGCAWHVRCHVGKMALLQCLCNY